MTSIDRFKALAARGGLVPVWRDCLLDGETPVSAFAKLRRGAFAFLLESAPAGGETWARYTFMGTEPRGAWRLKDGVAEDWTIERGWHGARTPADPLADLQALVAKHEPVEVPELGAFWSAAPEGAELRNLNGLVLRDERLQVRERICGRARAVPSALDRPVLGHSVLQAPRAARLGAHEGVACPCLAARGCGLEKKGASAPTQPVSYTHLTLPT